MSSNSILSTQNLDSCKFWIKGLYEAKYQFLITKHKSLGLKHCNGSKAFIEYSSDMDDV